MQYSYCVIRKATLLILTSLFILANHFSAQAQTYATVQTSVGLIKTNALAGSSTDSDYGTIIDTAYVTDASYTNAATLTAKCYYLAVLGFYGEAWIQPKFPAALSSGTTSYYRIDLPTSSGLSVDLLATVGALTNLFSKDLITISAYSGATASTVGTRISTPKVKKTLVADTAGNLYIAVTADSSYNSVRIGLRFDPGLLGISIASLSMKVYYGVTYSVGECSGRAPYSDLGAFGSGLTVALLDSVLKNPVNAIDNNLSTSSRLGGSSILSVSIADTISHSVYLKAPTSSTDNIRVILSTPGTVLNLGLANSIKIAAYRRDSLVSEQALGSILSLDLLGLLNSSTGVAVYVNPGGSFDRVKISYSHLVGVSLIGNGINIYDIRHVPAKPVVSKDTALIYQYTIPVLTATASSGDVITWYNRGGTALGTGGSFPVMDTISVDGPYYALAGKASCINLSDTAHLYLRTVPVVHTNPVVGTKGSAYASLVKSVAGAGMSGAGFRFVLASGSTLPAGLTLSSNGTLSGTPTVTDTVSFTVLITDTVNNMDAGRHTFNLVIRAPLQMPAMTLPDATAAVAYTATLPSANGGTGNYTYALAATPALPSGLGFNPATLAVSGSASPGTYPFRIDVSDDEGRSTFQNFSLLVGAPLPVHIVLFKGKMNQGSAALEWHTANESGIQSLLLQRSTDGSSWADIYTCNLSQHAGGQYQYRDEAAAGLRGTLLYRLKVVELNAAFSYSSVLRLSDEQSAMVAPVVYPSPVKAGTLVSCSISGNLAPMASIKVFSITGRQVYSAVNTYLLDTRLLTPGVYTVMMTGTDGDVSSARLVID